MLTPSQERQIKRKILETTNLLPQLYSEALVKARKQGFDEIELCGEKVCWEDCLAVYSFDENPVTVDVLFHFNIGRNTSAVKRVVPIKPFLEEDETNDTYPRSGPKGDPSPA